MVKHRTRERFEWYANAGTSHKIRAFLILNMSKADIFRHCPKENRSTCFRSILGISAPFRSETHPFRHSYLHCFRVLRSCLWDKLWSKRYSPNTASAVLGEFFVVCMVTLSVPKVKAFRRTNFAPQ